MLRRIPACRRVPAALQTRVLTRTGRRWNSRRDDRASGKKLRHPLSRLIEPARTRHCRRQPILTSARQPKFSCPESRLEPSRASRLRPWCQARENVAGDRNSEEFVELELEVLDAIGTSATVREDGAMARRIDVTSVVRSTKCQSLYDRVRPRYPDQLFRRCSPSAESPGRRQRASLLGRTRHESGGGPCARLARPVAARRRRQSRTPIT
jgi:hypothetical protein